MYRTISSCLKTKQGALFNYLYNVLLTVCKTFYSPVRLRLSIR